eukprot:SAG22_NODE_332_length_12161_cov_7.722066_3_plen_44_part_00
MDRLFDGDDGVEDGEDRALSNAYDQCAATPPAVMRLWSIAPFS